MKKYLLVVIILLLSASLWSQEVKIRKIKVTGNTYTNELVIRDLIVELKEGDRYELAKLERLLRFLEQRLMESGYFYSASVLATESATEPGTVNIVAEVEEGFLLRFGGGPYYMSFGIDNLGGLGKDLLLVGGLNAQQVHFSDRHTGLGSWFYSISLGNFPAGYIDSTGIKVPQQEVGGSFETGLRLGFNWEIAIFHSQGYNYSTEYQFQNYDISEGLRLRFHNVKGGFSPTEGFALSTSIATFQPEPFMRESLDLRAYFSPLNPWIKLAFRAFGSAQEMTPLDRPEHRQVLTGINSLRAPFEVSDLGFHKAVISGELRSEVVSINLFRIIALKIEPALVGDMGFIWNEETGKPKFRWAAGGAVRVFFGMPISLPLRFEYLWDDKSRGLYQFAVAAPF